MECISSSTTRPIVYAAVNNRIYAFHSSVCDMFASELFQFETRSRVSSLQFDASTECLIVGAERHLLVASAKTGMTLDERHCSLLSLAYCSEHRVLFTGEKLKVDSEGEAAKSRLGVFRLRRKGVLQLLDDRAEACNRFGDRMIYSLACDSKEKLLFVGRNYGGISVLRWQLDGSTDHLVEVDAGGASRQARVSCMSYDEARSVLFVTTGGDMRVWAWRAKRSTTPTAGAVGEGWASQLRKSLRRLSMRGSTTERRELHHELRALREPFSAHDGKPIIRLHYDPVHRYLFSNGKEGTMKVWRADLDGGELELAGSDRGAQAVCASFDPHQGVVLVGGRDKALRALRVGERGQLLECHRASEPAGGTYTATCLAYAPECKTLLVGGSDGALRGLQVTRLGPLVPTFAEEGAHDRQGVGCLAYDGEERRLFSAGRMTDARLRSWRLRPDGTLEPLHTAEFEYGTVECMSYDSFEKVLVTGGSDGTLIAWRVGGVAGGKEVMAQACRREGAHGADKVSCLAFDHSRHLLFSGGLDKAIRVWYLHGGCFDLRYSQEDAHCEGLVGARVCGLDYCPRLELLFSVGWDGRLRLWRVCPSGCLDEGMRREVEIFDSAASAASAASTRKAQCVISSRETNSVLVFGEANVNRAFTIDPSTLLVSESYFPCNLFRGDAVAVTSAPNDKFEFIWMLTNNGVVMAFSGRLLSFGLDAACPPSLQKPRGYLDYLREFEFIEKAKYQFRGSVAVIASLACMFVGQEHFQNKALLFPDKIGPSLVYVLMGLLLMVGCGAGFLPLMVPLLDLIPCDQGILQADPKVQCRGFEHFALWLVPGLLSAAVHTYISVRFVRSRYNLDGIVLRRSYQILDWTRDSMTMSNQLPRSHPLVLKDCTYDIGALAAAFLMQAAMAFSPLLTPEPEWQRFWQSVVTVLSGLMLVFNSWTYDRFFDPGPTRALPLPGGLEPNALQTACDLGILWCYPKFVAASAVVIFGSDVLKRRMFATLPWACRSSSCSSDTGCAPRAPAGGRSTSTGR
ncbi:unnamed protein product [Prorocentrum cordatum]|uniref:Uncharacterized protein n=1 Tax=Prorocentrum cordatum TaxID=2364126 RepID=A0ABN9XAQ5_9DINO|nr:unnamed protein product [Polarella glacialis]